MITERKSYQDSGSRGSDGVVIKSYRATGYDVFNATDLRQAWVKVLPGWGSGLGHGFFNVGANGFTGWA